MRCGGNRLFWSLVALQPSTSSLTFTFLTLYTWSGFFRVKALAAEISNVGFHEQHVDFRRYRPRPIRQDHVEEGQKSKAKACPTSPCPAPKAVITSCDRRVEWVLKEVGFSPIGIHFLLLGTGMICECCWAEVKGLYWSYLGWRGSQLASVKVS